jgi:hypothetical protein
MSAEFKRMNVPFEFDAESKALDEEGKFTGYGSVFEVIDLDREVIARGAFTKTLNEWRRRKRLPPVLWQHNTREPLGPYTDMVEDDKGLKVEGQLLIHDIQKAREARALMRAKAVDGLSIGFMTKKWKPDEERRVRVIEEVELLEVSIVTMPANPKATVMDAKGNQSITVEQIETLTTMKEFEEILREAGFSRAAATAFVAKCINQSESGGSNQRESGSEMERFAKSLEQVLSSN